MAGIASYMKYFNYATSKILSEQQKLIESMVTYQQPLPEEVLNKITNCSEAADIVSSLVKHECTMINDLCTLTGQELAQFTVFQRDRWLVSAPNYLPSATVNQLRTSDLPKPDVFPKRLLEETLLQKADLEMKDYLDSTVKKSTLLHAQHQFTQKEKEFTGLDSW